MIKKLLLSFLLLIQINVFTQERKEVIIPDIPGFITLKGDFHMHTPFSDGTVWPADRVVEAWMEGLDVIAITPHIEWHAYEDDVKSDLNRPYEIALPAAKKYGMILIRAGEITRSMPPGHFNAYFLEDVNALKVDDYMDAFEEADRQGAFIIWNHPGWKAQQPDTTLWFKEHDVLYEKGWLNGIEIVNEDEYYPIVHQWAMDKNLTMFGNSDIHSPIVFKWNKDRGEHRPFTLLFVKEKSKEGVREAFENRTTAVYYKDKLIGDRRFLEPLFNTSVHLKNPEIALGREKTIYLQLHNTSDIDFNLSARDKVEGVEFQKEVSLPAQRTRMLRVKLNSVDAGENLISLPYQVDNALIAPGKPLPVDVKFEVVSLNPLKIIPEKEGAYMIQLKGLGEGTGVFYTIDNSTPGISSSPYTESFKADSPLTLKYCAFKKGMRISEVFKEDFYPHMAIGSQVTYATDYVGKYSGGGKDGLVNGFTGSESYGDGNWQGFRGGDLDVVIDLGKQMDLSEVRVNFLNATYAWIFPPVEVEISVSKNGDDFETIQIVSFDIPEKLEETEVVEVMSNVKSKARFIKVKAKNIGALPEWHTGKGKDAWLFVDEVVVK